MDGCRAIFSQTWITDPPIGLYFPFLKDAPNAQLSKRNDGQEDLRRRKAKELPQYFRKVVSAGIFCLCRRHGPQPHRTSAMGTLLMIRQPQRMDRSAAGLAAEQTCQAGDGENKRAKRAGDCLNPQLPAFLLVWEKEKRSSALSRRRSRRPHPMCGMGPPRLSAQQGRRQYIAPVGS